MNTFHYILHQRVNIQCNIPYILYLETMNKFLDNTFCLPLIPEITHKNKSGLLVLIKIFNLSSLVSKLLQSYTLHSRRKWITLDIYDPPPWHLYTSGTNIVLNLHSQKKKCYKEAEPPYPLSFWHFPVLFDAGWPAQLSTTDCKMQSHFNLTFPARIYC